MKIKKMFNVDDPANASTEESKVIETKVEEPKKEETVKDAGSFKGFTADQVLKMKEDLKIEHQKELATERLKARDDYKNELLQEKELAEKQIVFDKIEGNEKLKQSFEEYGADYKTMDKTSLDIVLSIFEDKKSETTANPAGEGLINPNSNIDADKIISDVFTQKGV